VRDPVQVGRRTKENLREINDFLAVAHVPIVSPLARDLVLHGFRKPWKTIGKTCFWTTADLENLRGNTVSALAAGKHTIAKIVKTLA